MAKKIDIFKEVKLIEEFSEKSTPIHNLHPVTKVLTTVIFIVVTLSFNKYEISGMVPLIFYPVIISSIGEIPLKVLIKKTITPMPLIIGIGIFNPLFYKEPMVIIQGVFISAGWISFLSIVIRGVLSIMAAQLLIGTTGISKIGSALRMLKVPKVFVLQIMLTYRYITLFVEEVSRTIRAYTIRSYNSKGIKLSEGGSLIGGLLLRTIDRAERVYHSMCCRGFSGEYNDGAIYKIKKRDIIYVISMSLIFFTIRFYNLPKNMERLILEVLTWKM